jgi:hypothetical protein
MSDHANSTEITCWSCNIDTATEPFPYAGRETKVCARCLAWLKARDDLDGLLREALTLESQQDTEDLLIRFDIFLKTNEHVDTTGEFARKLAHHRVLILIDAERYAEAEVACTQWRNLGFANAWEQREHGYESARIMRVMGKPDQALHTLDEALRHHDQYFLGIAEKFELLVELVQELDLMIKPEHVELAAKVAEVYEVAFDEQQTPAETLLTVARYTQNKVPRAGVSYSPT